MRKPLLLAALLALAPPAFAAPDTAAPAEAVRSDVRAQAPSANDQAVANGTNVQTAQTGQATAEDGPPSGPQKQHGTMAPAPPASGR